MPANITVYTVEGNTSAVVTWSEPSGADNSGIQTLTSSHSPPFSFPLGRSVVQYTSTDLAGNQVTEEMHVLVTYRKKLFIVINIFLPAVMAVAHSKFEHVTFYFRATNLDIYFSKTERPIFETTFPPTEGH